MQTPLLSVVIPVYNSEDTINTAVFSILKQPNIDLIEILLIDDGSTDNSGRILEELCTANSNVVVYHKDNGGVSSARNLGIMHASGKYLAFLDSDDWWEPKYFTNDIVERMQNDKSAGLF